MKDRDWWFEVLGIAALLILLFAVAGVSYLHGKHDADRWHAAHPTLHQFDIKKFTDANWDCDGLTENIVVCLPPTLPPEDTAENAAYFHCTKLTGQRCDEYKRNGEPKP